MPSYKRCYDPKVPRSTLRIVIVGFGIVLATGSLRIEGSSPLQATQAAPSTSAQTSRTPNVSAAPDREFLSRNCVMCHNERLQTAGLALDAVDFSGIGTEAAKWEKVVRKL